VSYIKEPLWAQPGMRQCSQGLQGTAGARVHAGHSRASLERLLSQALPRPALPSWMQVSPGPALPSPVNLLTSLTALLAWWSAGLWWWAGLWGWGWGLGLVSHRGL